MTRSLMDCLVCSVILIVFTGCTSLKEFTSPPSVYANNTPLKYDPSIFSIKVDLPISAIEKTVNDKTRNGLSLEDTVEFKETYRAKTDNPLYNPTKWIKKRNPAYNNHKWIKKCVSGFGFKSCVKTKNPFYNPKKLLKTKNPLYNPSRYLYANAITVDVDADWEVTISRNDKFEILTNKDDRNSLRLIFPLKLDGSVGFRGDGAKLLSLNKKNFRGEIDILVDLNIAIKPDWCPDVTVNVDYKWRKGSGIELIGGQWLDLSGLINLGNLVTKPAIRNAVNQHLNCETFKKGLAQATKPNAIVVADFVEDKLSKLSINSTSDQRLEATINDGLRKLYFNYHIKEVSTTGEITDGKNISLDLSIKANTYFDTKPLIEEESSFPDLVIKEAPDVNLLEVTLPLVAKYEVLNDFLNTPENLITLNECLLETEAIQINKFEFFPKGDVLGMKVNVSVKSENSVLASIVNRLPFIRNLFNTTGDVYLTATPYLNENKIVRVKDVKFVVDADNELYNLVNNAEFGLAYYLETLDLIKFGEKIETFKADIPNLVQKMMQEKKNISLELTDTIFNQNADVIVGNDSLMYVFGAKTGFNLEFKP
jgi:hypothetical protein